MSKSNAAEAALLRLWFLNEPIAGLGDATGVRGSAAAGKLYLSLHSADPGEAANQATSELAYPGYARVGVDRGAAEFDVDDAAGVVSLINSHDFPKMGQGAQVTARFWGVGTKATGTGLLLYSGAVDPEIPINEGVYPRLEGQADGDPTFVSED